MIYDNVHTEWLDEYERQEGYKILLCHHPEFYEPYLKERKGSILFSQVMRMVDRYGCLVVVFMHMGKDGSQSIPKVYMTGR